jgi:hypothetical protein
MSYPLVKTKEEIVEYVMNLHEKEPYDPEYEYLKEKIRMNEIYELRDVNISQIEETCRSDRETKIIEYKKMDQKTMPPIVLGKQNPEGIFFLIDGSHRKHIRVFNGHKTIRAYIPKK